MKQSLFRWHKQLNIKKVIFVVCIIFLLLIAIIGFVGKTIEETKKQAVAEANPNTVFYDANKQISIELSKKYALTQYTPTKDYLLEVRSNKNLDIFISQKDILENRNLQDVVSADKITFTETFPSISNLSELKELNVNGNLAYTYSFHYLDSQLNTAFFIQIVWLQIDNHYYIFDIEFPLDDLSLYTNIITETLAYFQSY